MNKGSLVALESRGILRVSGRDALAFIQGYITSDINTLTDSIWQSGAFCNLQGRMVSNFRMVRQDSELLISMDKSLVDTTCDFLKKYIVFSKAETHDETAEYRLLGVSGAEGQAAITDILGTFPAGESGCSQVDGQMILAIPGDVPRCELWLNSAEAEGIIQQLTEQLTPTASQIWTLADIRAGWCWLSAETSGQYIPQMINLQAQDAISFKKGCYLGQEIVARMQYLGQLKRRMYRLRVAATVLPAVGDKLYAKDGTAVGEVVMSAASNSDYEVLAVCREPGEGPLTMESGAIAEILSLPYHCVSPELL